MQRNRKSLFNALSAALLTVFNGLFGLVSVKFVLTYFGSDFNGLNSTANQLVSVLMLLEGGFTVATNVALFKPYFEKDYDKVNSIISATQNTFRKIGLISLAAGALVAVGYSLVINSELPRFLVFCVLFMTMLPICFNFYYATKYRILLQAEQKEYVISAITIITSTLGYLINIIAMPLGCSMWFVRFTTMIFALINSLLIGVYVKKKFPHINYHEKPDYQAIKGTGDIFAQKLTGVFYSSAPIVCITLTAGGTMLASVYAVYNSVFVLLKGVMQSVINAPRLSLGELAAQEEKERVWKVYEQYELIVVLMLVAFLTTASVMIMPFISIYTRGVTDIDYNQPLIAFLLSLICYFELIHIPSGHLMNMTGRFRASRNFQIIALVVMLSGFLVSLIFKWSIYGILITVCITAICLSAMEIGYVHTQYFEKKLLAFFRSNIPFFVLGIFLIIVEMRFLPAVTRYASFFLLAIVVFLLNLVIVCVISCIFNKNCTINVMKLLLSFIKKIE